MFCKNMKLYDHGNIFVLYKKYDILHATVFHGCTHCWRMWKKANNVIFIFITVVAVQSTKAGFCASGFLNCH